MARSNHDDFDGYRKWLGITNKKRLPTHYELLAISLDEDDPEVIQAAAEQRRHFVESKRGDGHDAIVTEILYRISEAENTLLNNEMRRDYDRQRKLWEKRQKNRQIDPIASRSRVRSRPEPTVGEGTGFVSTFAGILGVFCVAIAIMTWFSFQLPWFESADQVEAAPIVQVPAPVAAPAQVAPVAVKPDLAKPQATEPPSAEVERATIADEITNSIGMKLKLIRAGEFLMGSPDNETGRDSDETQHRVQLTTSYYLGVTEVTQGQWFAMMQTKPWSGKDYVKKEGEDYPAMHVSWDDAVEYSVKLSAAEGKTYRLPTEAEWEYACRGGKSTAYSFGSDATRLKDYAWLRANALNIGETYAHEVGTKQSNPFGLHDMHGNVYEWCSDWPADYDSSFAVDPSGLLTGSDRVFRGGCWLSEAADCRSAYRFRFDDPTYRGSDVGFRLALSPSVK